MKNKTTIELTNEELEWLEWLISGLQTMIRMGYIDKAVEKSGTNESNIIESILSKLNKEDGK